MKDRREKQMVLKRKKVKKEITIQLPQKKKQKISCYRSRERKRNHMVITLVTDDENTGQKIKEEIQKTVKRLENLLEDGISFELHM